MTNGSVAFEGGHARPPRGVLGIVPQKNVLFPELTCYQTIQVWAAIKKSKNSPVKEDLIQLLKDCDLGAKIHANAGSLSGGQKRKLQLAIGLVGGSDSKCASYYSRFLFVHGSFSIVVLVDEVPGFSSISTFLVAHLP